MHEEGQAYAEAHPPLPPPAVHTQQEAHCHL